jgi:hypothetical protein
MTRLWVAFVCLIEFFKVLPVAMTEIAHAVLSDFNIVQVESPGVVPLTG